MTSINYDCNVDSLHTTPIKRTGSPSEAAVDEAARAADVDRRAVDGRPLHLQPLGDELRGVELRGDARHGPDRRGERRRQRLAREGEYKSRRRQEVAPSRRRPSASSTRPSCSTTTTSTCSTGRSTNVLGVALGDSVYLWNASDGSIQQLMQTKGEQTHVTSLAWMRPGQLHGGRHLRPQGADLGRREVQAGAHDGPATARASRRSRGTARCLLAARTRLDRRPPRRPPAAAQGRPLRGHTQEVCGLKWSRHGTQLASGGNDNLLNVWDDRYATRSTNGDCDATPLHRLDAAPGGRQGARVVPVAEATCSRRAAAPPTA